MKKTTILFSILLYFCSVLTLSAQDFLSEKNYIALVFNQDKKSEKNYIQLKVDYPLKKKAISFFTIATSDNLAVPITYALEYTRSTQTYGAIKHHFDAIDRKNFDLILTVLSSKEKIFGPDHSATIQLFNLDNFELTVYEANEITTVPSWVTSSWEAGIKAFKTSNNWKPESTSKEEINELPKQTPDKTTVSNGNSNSSVPFTAQNFYSQYYIGGASGHHATYLETYIQAKVEYPLKNKALCYLTIVHPSYRDGVQTYAFEYHESKNLEDGIMHHFRTPADELLPSYLDLRLYVLTDKTLYKTEYLSFESTVVIFTRSVEGVDTSYFANEDNLLPAWVYHSWEAGLNNYKKFNKLRTNSNPTANINAAPIHGYKTHTFDDGNAITGNWANGKLNGKGKGTFTNGDVYDGNYLDTIRHGLGKYTWKDGTWHDGNWANNNRNGFGKRLYNDGAVYAGYWKDDKRNGLGKLTWKEGTWYDGNWTSDNREGFGKQLYNDGAVYAGYWKDDKRNGLGKLTWQEGSWFDGNWLNDFMDGYGKRLYIDGAVYEGYWKQDKNSGKGKLTYPDNSVYAGMWNNGEKQGAGKFTYPDGTYYDGKWLNSEASGQGTITSADGSVFTGQWKNSKRHGIGKKTTSSNDVLEGNYVEDKMDGRFIWQYSDGRVVEIIYTNGQQVSQQTIKHADDFEGIGIAFNYNDTLEHFVIVTVGENLPAHRAGILVGDIIFSADGVLLSGKTVSEIVPYLKGPSGSSVKLGIIRGGLPTTVSVTRGKISSKAIRQGD